MKKYSLLLAFIVATVPSLYAQIVQPVETPPVTAEKKDPRRAMLAKLIEAGILMLEGGAYRQFIHTFVSDEDRRRFEKAYSKSGPVDYARWGVEKGQPMLAILRQLAAIEPEWVGERACYAAEGLPQQKFSFIYAGDGWFIENRSVCPAKPASPSSQ